MDETTAATKIQAVHRGNAARAEAKAARQHDDRTKAATKIQALHRGNAARREVQARRGGGAADGTATPTPAAPRGEDAQNSRENTTTPTPNGPAEPRRDDQARAATKIQALHRGNHGRRVAAERKEKHAQAQAAAVAPEQAALDAPQQPPAPAGAGDVEVQAATKIQAVHRGNQGRQAARQRRQAAGTTPGDDAAEAAAATKIQAVHRGHAARREAAERRRARGGADHPAPEDGETTVEEKGEEDTRRAQAATKIQALHRGNQARTAVRAPDTRNGRDAPVAADAEAKGDADDVLATREAQAATKIQAVHRGNVARRDVRERRQSGSGQQQQQQQLDTAGDEHTWGAKEQATRAHAATKIQARHRGNVARREAREKRAARREYDAHTDEEARAATRIQALHRGNQARSEAQRRRAARHAASMPPSDEQTKAATRIQAVHRGNMVRRGVDAERAAGDDADADADAEAAAATKIQALHRGNMARRDMDARRSTGGARVTGGADADADAACAATKIQAVHRGNMARRESRQAQGRHGGAGADGAKGTGDRDAAATNIQRIYRGKRGRDDARRARRLKEERVGGVVALMLYWQLRQRDHRVVARGGGRRASALKSSGYTCLGEIGALFATDAEREDLVAIHNVFSQKKHDSMLVTRSFLDDAANAAALDGYSDIGVVGYAYAQQKPGTIPLAIHHSTTRGDSFPVCDKETWFTAWQSEMFGAKYEYAHTAGWILVKDDGATGAINPTPTPTPSSPTPHVAGGAPVGAMPGGPATPEPMRAGGAGSASLGPTPQPPDSVRSTPSARPAPRRGGGARTAPATGGGGGSSSVAGGTSSSSGTSGGYPRSGVPATSRSRARMLIESLIMQEKVSKLAPGQQERMVERLHDVPSTKQKERAAKLDKKAKLLEKRAASCAHATLPRKQERELVERMYYDENRKASEAAFKLQQQFLPEAPRTRLSYEAEQDFHQRLKDHADWLAYRKRQRIESMVPVGPKGGTHKRPKVWLDLYVKELHENLPTGMRTPIPARDAGQDAMAYGINPFS